MASVYFPEMECDLDKIGLWYTADEPSVLTDDAGVEWPFDLPSTAVRGVWPDQTVDACQGTGKGVILSIPAEPVIFGVAQRVPVTGSLNGRAFTGTLPIAFPVSVGFRRIKVQAVTMAINFTTQLKGGLMATVRPEVAWARMYEICDSNSRRARAGREEIVLKLQQHITPATYQSYGEETFTALVAELKNTTPANMASVMSGQNTQDGERKAAASATIATIANNVAARLGLSGAGPLGPIFQEIIAAIQQALTTLLPQLLACLGGL